MTENSISSSSFSSERTKCQMKSSGIPWIGEIPSDWMKNTIGRLSDSISSGGTPKAGDSRFYTDEGVSFVSISDMSNVDYVTQTNKHLTELGIKDKKLTVYPAGTILYSIYATLGKVSELAIPAAINQAMLAIVPSEELDKGYFKYSLKAMENYIVSVSNGNTQNNLSAEIVSHAVIPLPPIEVQKRISVLLDNRCNLIDSQISSVEDSVSKIEYLKQ
ncbi:MAG: restriction endonuclease subunit S [Candidatus Methanomethylophilaceae archaeon]|nr:restriction endonuclease subunit S [Candidatus Methanomethylophilaceae archaeon]